MTTGDGIVAALQVLLAMQMTGKPLSELKRGMVKYPQVVKNVRMTRRVDPMAIPAVHDAVRATEAELGNTGRVLLRPSGTEPVVRVMIEGQDAAQVERLTVSLSEAVENALDAS
jgi:phosphoglucosamine mutase